MTHVNARTTWRDEYADTVHAVVVPLEKFCPGARAPLAAALTSEIWAVATDGTWDTVCGVTLPRKVILDPHEDVTCPACLADAGGPLVAEALRILGDVREPVTAQSTTALRSHARPRTASQREDSAGAWQMPTAAGGWGVPAVRQSTPVNALRGSESAPVMASAVTSGTSRAVAVREGGVGMTRPIPTMTPDEIVEWERKARAGELFTTIGPPRVRKPRAERVVVHGGSGNGYSYHGCRCDECREANNARMRRRRKERYRMPEKAAPHGRYTTYSNWGCRCPLCREAWSVACREQRAKRAARKAAA